MLRNYLIAAFRNLWSHKSFAVLNILGLVLGLTCVILILLYVRTETSFDKHHSHRNEIYLVSLNLTNPQTGVKNKRAIGPFRLADELKVDFPDLASIVRFAPQVTESVEVGEEVYEEEKLAFIDPEILTTFDFPLIEGDSKNVLKDPFSVVVTREIARKYFGTENSLGKIIRIRDNDYKITGILREPVKATQFDFQIFVSMNSSSQVFSKIVRENWGEGYVWTFIRTPVENDASFYHSRLQEFVQKKMEAWKSYQPEIELKPLKDLYLSSGDYFGFVPGGDGTYVLAFTFIAFFILVIACINFMNLATARSSIRAKEVGLRKVVGAERKQLIGQFLSESTFLAFICLLLSLLAVRWLLPSFNQLADRQIEFHLFDDPLILIGAIILALTVGILSGIYPALILSGFSPIRVFSGNLAEGLKGTALRKILVTFQFAISIFLLIITSVIYLQMLYCRNFDPGFDRNQLIVLEGTSLDLRGRYEQFRNELLKNPTIINAGASSRVPPGRLQSSLRARPEGIPADEQRGMQTVWTDFDFIETLGVELASGRSFSRSFPADATTGFILNEAAVRELGWTNENAIDKTFGSSEIKDWDNGQWEDRNGKVIGVLKDFHFESLKQEIIPTVYFIAPYMAWNYLIRIKSGDLTTTLKYIEEQWKTFNPESSFQYSFVSDNFAELYQNEERQGKIFTIFAVLAILIACLGLIGLSAFSAERRKKEVGIRKVLGASSFTLVYLLSREFLILLLVAFVIAAPLSWIITRKWMENFAYQTEVNLWVYLLAGLFTFLIAWSTMSFQTIKAATGNPAEVIRIR